MSQLPQQLRCTLLIPSPSEEGAWGFIPPNANNEQVFVNLTEKGIRLSFSRDTDRSIWAWYSPDLEMTTSALYHITIELPGFGADIRSLTSGEVETFKCPGSGDEAEDLRIVKLTSTPEKSCHPRIIGFGTPFHGLDQTVDGWVNQGTKIFGVASLVEILQGTDFTILVKATYLERFVSALKTPRNPETYGYGEVHTWDMARYMQQIPKLRGRAFEPRVRFENANERDTALTQMHVQDVWDFNHALEDIAEMEIPSLI